MKYGYLLARRGQYWADSWTYGDWEQFIVKRRDGRTQCAKLSLLPQLVMLIGLLVLGFAVTALLVNQPWKGVPALIAGFIMFCGPFFASLAGYHLMVFVGPPNRGQHRVLPGEE